MPRTGSAVAVLTCVAVVLTGSTHTVAREGEGTFWYVPVERGPSAGVASFASGRTRDQYAAYRAGVASLRAGRFSDARARFASLARSAPVGYLSEAAVLGQAEAAMGAGDFSGARDLYRGLSARPLQAGDLVWRRLADTHLALGATSAAADAFIHVIAAYPLSEHAEAARVAVDTMSIRDPRQEARRRDAEVARAGALFAAKRYDDAAIASRRILSAAAAPAKQQLTVYIGASEYFTQRYAAARATLRPVAQRGIARDQARYFDARALLALGRPREFEQAVSALAQTFPTSLWSASALDQLATHFIRVDDDALADETFRIILRRWPSGPYAARAAWKVGWRAYRGGRYAEAARVFTAASASTPVSEYTPSLLYWTARSLEAMGDTTSGGAAYATVQRDYGHSFYGPFAASAMQRLALTAMPTAPAGMRSLAKAPPRAPNSRLIEDLIATGSFEDALTEVTYAEATSGESAALAATRAWLLNRRGDFLAGAIAARRAYPDVTAGRDRSAPDDLLRVMYPLAYWPLIESHAGTHRVDPFVLAALIAQESMFNATARSRANAVGLTQLLPATAERYARRNGMPDVPARLTDPATNIYLGAAYLSDLVRQLGDLHLALAGYNAGENRVQRWKMERPSLGLDEFVDDIPFPETQNYVKTILSAAERYREIYGSAGPEAQP